MRVPDAQDRLAVWTYQEAGEEIPLGDPSVTDAEREAAGRETLAHRGRAIVSANRSRAAAQFTADGLPDGQDVLRVWRPRDPAGLRARLAEQPLALWAEDDVLHVLWRGRAEEVMLGGGVRPQLWPVEGTDDLWEASLRIRRLDEAVITVLVVPRPAGGDWPTRLTERFVWRGPAAPAAPAGQPLQGLVTDHTLDSSALGTSRQVTVYRPPGRPLAGCVLADGEATRGFAQQLDPANGRNGCSAPGCPAGTPNGSAATIRCGGSSNSRSRWAGCSHRRAPAPAPGARWPASSLAA
jgi:hypothetical protein